MITATDRPGRHSSTEAREPIRAVTFLGPKIKGIFGPGILAAMECNGIEVHPAERLDPELVRADRILLVGPMQHLTEPLKSLAEFRDALPPVRVWFTEQIPNPALPGFAAEYLCQARQRADLTRFGYGLPGTRFRVAGEMLALHQLTDDLKIHTFSDTNTIFLRKLGLPADTLPIGTDAVFGQRSDIPFPERAVPVLFLGSTEDRRRGPIIGKLQKELEQRHIDLTVRSKQNPVYSDARTKLLRETRIFLAIGRHPHDDQHVRLVFGGTNRNLVIAEETLETSKGAFVPGVDYLEVPIRNMPEAVEHFHDRPDEAELIADKLNRKVHETSLIDQIGGVLE